MFLASPHLYTWAFSDQLLRKMHSGSGCNSQMSAKPKRKLSRRNFFVVFLLHKTWIVKNGWFWIPVELKSLRRSWKYSQKIRSSTSFDQSSRSVVSFLTLSICRIIFSIKSSRKQDGEESFRKYAPHDSSFHLYCIIFILVHKSLSA